MINYLPRLAHKAATYRSKAPTKAQTLQAILINTIAFTVIIGSILWISTFSDDTQPGPTKDEKAQVEREQSTPNAPDFESHKKRATRVCKGPVIASGDQVFANWVVVVKQNGQTVRMSLDRAFKMNGHENTEVWVIGVCKKDLLKSPLG